MEQENGLVKAKRIITTIQETNCWSKKKKNCQHQKYWNLLWIVEISLQY